MIMPHDGYHYPLRQLRAMPNAPDLIYRRGAPDTFDAAALGRDLDRIRHRAEELLISLPGFDHARGDPDPNRHVFDRTAHDIVICEGLYLLHNADGWEGTADYFDVTIFIDADLDACLDRLKVRNRCIPGYTAEEIAVRCDQVDRVNAETVLLGQPFAHYVVVSSFGATASTPPAAATTASSLSLTPAPNSLEVP
jgi:pantothenate kinase